MSLNIHVFHPHNKRSHQGFPHRYEFYILAWLLIYLLWFLKDSLKRMFYRVIYLQEHNNSLKLQLIRCLLHILHLVIPFQKDIFGLLDIQLFPIPVYSISPNLQVNCKGVQRINNSYCRLDVNNALSYINCVQANHKHFKNLVHYHKVWALCILYLKYCLSDQHLLSGLNIFIRSTCSLLFFIFFVLQLHIRLSSKIQPAPPKACSQVNKTCLYIIQQYLDHTGGLLRI